MLPNLESKNWKPRIIFLIQLGSCMIFVYESSWTRIINPNKALWTIVCLTYIKKDNLEYSPLSFQLIVIILFSLFICIVIENDANHTWNRSGKNRQTGRFSPVYLLTFRVVKLVCFACFHRFSRLEWSKYISLKLFNLQISNHHQSPGRKYRAQVFSSDNEGIGSYWINLLRSRKISEPSKVELGPNDKFFTSKFHVHFSRLLLIDCQKVSITSSFQVMLWLRKYQRIFFCESYASC
jgi:hypothetical protein